MPLSTTSSGASPSGGDQTPAKIRGMFGSITPWYDRLNHLFSFSMDKRWRRKAARSAQEGLLPCSRMLDVATGTGDLAAELKTTGCRLRPESHGELKIAGADFTEPMLRLASEKYGRSHYRWI